MPRDGLGAARHYLGGRRDVRASASAEMDRFPLADASVDLVVNAASLHYAVGEERYERPSPRPRACSRRAARSRSSTARSIRATPRARRCSTSGAPTIRRRRPSGYLVRTSSSDDAREAGLEPSFETHWMGWGWTLNYVRHRARSPRACGDAARNGPQSALSMLSTAVTGVVHSTVGADSTGRAGTAGVLRPACGPTLSVCDTETSARHRVRARRPQSRPFRNQALGDGRLRPGRATASSGSGPCRR